MDWNLERNKKQRMNYILTWRKKDRKKREGKKKTERRGREEEKNEDGKKRKGEKESKNLGKKESKKEMKTVSYEKDGWIICERRNQTNCMSSFFNPSLLLLSLLTLLLIIFLSLLHPPFSSSISLL